MINHSYLHPVKLISKAQSIMWLTVMFNRLTYQNHPYHLLIRTRKDSM